MATAARSVCSVFRFGDFEFRAEVPELRKFGLRLKLQRKPLLVLIALLENAGEVVARDQLQRTLWPDDVFVDFELGLNVAVKKLRDVLSDSAEQPRFIETVVGSGYRFVAPIERVTSALPVAQTAPGMGLPEQPHGQSFTVKETIAKPHAIFAETSPTAADIAETQSDARPWIRMVAAACLLVAAALSILWLLRPGVKFRSGDWVLVGAFENHTGDKSFDGSIEYGFEREIGESRYVNVVSRARVDDTLLLMRQKKGTPLDDNLARQVALRDTGVRAVLSGRIERFDSNYVLTARLIEPGSGRVVAVFEQSGTKDEVPRAIRRIADSLRDRLGESAPPTREILQRATTTSIEALQAFSSGMQAIGDDKWQEGATLFEGATAIDPQFALAHVFAGHAYEQLGNEEKARTHFKTAFDLSNGTSERERLFIRGSYFARFERDPVRASREFLTLVNLYPDDLWGVKLLLWNSTAGNPVLLHSTGMTPADRVELLERVVRLRPTSPDSLMDLMYLTRYALHDHVRSEMYRERLAELRAGGAPANWIELDLLPVLEAWRGGDIATADRELQRLTEEALAQTSIRMQFDVAMANLQMGHLSVAQRVCASLPPVMERSTNMNRQNCSLVVAYLRGNRAAAAHEAKAILEATPARDVDDINVMGINVMLHAGLLHEAEMLLARRPRSRIAPQLHGKLLLAHGKPAEAFDVLRLDYTPLDRALTTRGSYFLTREAMARALAELGSLDEAIRILRETDPTNVRYMSASTWPHARLLLIQLLRQAGRRSEADNIEAELRHYMAFADKDHIVLRALNSEDQLDHLAAKKHTDRRNIISCNSQNKRLSR